MKRAGVAVKDLIQLIVEVIFNSHQAFYFKLLTILGTLVTYSFNYTLERSRPRGPVFGHRAARISFARSSQCLTAPDIHKALNPKTDTFLIAIVYL